MKEKTSSPIGHEKLPRLLVIPVRSPERAKGWNKPVNVPPSNPNCQRRRVFIGYPEAGFSLSMAIIGHSKYYQNDQEIQLGNS